MTPTTFTLYALLITGDGQETERRPVSYGRTAEQCLVMLTARQPSMVIVDLGYGPEAVETVYGCEMESAADRESVGVGVGGDLERMFEAAAREDWK